MINPKLIEVFGESSRALFAGLIEIVGYDMADKYYVNTRVIIDEDGVKRPRYMSSELGNATSIQNRVYNYVYNITGNDDALGIYIFSRKPKNYEVQLCLN